MTDTVFLLNYAILISAVVVSVFGLMTTLLIHDSNKADRRYFLCFFILLGLSSLAQLICELSKNAVLSQITMFASSLLSSMVMVPLLTYMLRCAGKNWKRNPFLYIVSGLWVGYLILLIVTQFTTFIYYFTPDNVYHRGPLYPLLLLPIILFLLINVISLFLYRSALTRRQRISFLAYLVIPLVCMFIQILFYGILLIAFGSTVAVFYMLVCFLIEQSEKSIRQAEENARQQASIHVLQMRPHFICNTMMSIYYLIPQDAQKAQQVTLDFTTYLRNNFTAIATPDTIPFEKELEHTRAFLAVEKVRHENQLFVEWDTPYTDFRLPPLTIQPIVENAVVHGVSPDLEPLRISIKTEKTDDGVEIVIQDNGGGFTEINEDVPHTALKNITERLKRQCDGTITIDSSADGTTVKLFIPQKE